MQVNKMITLPTPSYRSNISIENALHERKSVRAFADAPLSLSELSQLLWAAQGITRKNGMRTAPSAGALYPLEVIVVAGNIKNLEAGIYRYRPSKHDLIKMLNGDKRHELTTAALGQHCISQAPIIIVLTAIYERTAVKYGSRAVRYVHMETGHAGQNIYLQAVSLGLGTVVVGAFDDEQVARVLDLTDDEHPLSIMPVGKIN